MWEVGGFEDYNPLADWNPSNDSFRTDFQKSFLIDRIAEKRGLTKQSLLNEISKRQKFLSRLARRDVKDHEEVAKAIMNYYQRKATPEAVSTGKK